jgi:hypothetical protein
MGLRGRPKNHPLPMAITPGSVLRGSTPSSGDDAWLVQAHRFAPMTWRRVQTSPGFGAGGPNRASR